MGNISTEKLERMKKTSERKRKEVTPIIFGALAGGILSLTYWLISLIATEWFNTKPNIYSLLFGIITLIIITAKVWIEYEKGAGFTGIKIPLPLVFVLMIIAELLAFGEPMISLILPLLTFVFLFYAGVKMKISLAASLLQKGIRFFRTRFLRR